MTANETNIRLIRWHSRHLPILLRAGGTAGGSATAAGGTRSTFKLPSNGEGKGRHHTVNFLALTFGAGNLFGCIQY